MKHTEKAKEQKQVPTELVKAVKLLKRHNRWRRGAEVDQVHPTELGLAIDTIVRFMESNVI